jgi:VWFA-related protein
LRRAVTHAKLAASVADHTYGGSMATRRLASTFVACVVAGAAARQAPTDQPTFRVAVDAVTIDAVVTADDGTIVPDLTANDFAVYQDGRKQRLLTATFVPVTSGTSRAGSPDLATPRSRFPEGARLSSPLIAREHVGRTIVIVVDDLGLSGQGLLRLLPALRRFVDTEVLATDAVAIVRTGESNGLVQTMTQDRDALFAAIDALRYNSLSRKGPWAMGDVTQLGNSPPQFDGPERPLATLESLSALTFVVRAARDLPGRKAVVVASEGFQSSLDGTATTTGLDPRVRDAIERVADQAVRSGVVLYALDCTGLETGGLRASDDIHYVPDMNAAVNRFATTRQHALRDAQQSLAYLTEQTGGFAIVNTNDLANGLSRIAGDIRGYYVIGYAPDADTFAVDPRLARRHSISVKLNRPGLRVRTRRAFMGISDPEATPHDASPAQTLVGAAISPFSTSTIGLDTTNLPGYWPGRGLFVRSVLRLDGRALTFEASPDGSRTATIDLVGLVFDSDGTQVHDISTGFDVTLEAHALDRVVEDGLAYVARVPIAKAGGYQVRFAVRDRRSGRIGTGGGFVAIPDVPGGTFALSGLVLRANQGDGSAAALQSDRFSVPPKDARRSFTRGTTLFYSYQVYNGDGAVRSRASLWRADHQVMETPPVILPPAPAGLPRTAAGQITLGVDLPPGAYVLQVAAEVPARRGPSKERTAIQRMSFDVR